MARKITRSPSVAMQVYVSCFLVVSNDPAQTGEPSGGTFQHVQQASSCCDGLENAIDLEDNAAFGICSQFCV